MTLQDSTHLMNLSLIFFLFFLSEISSNPDPDVIKVYAFVELMRLLISGWVVFTIFYRPGATKPFPDKIIRENPKEALRMIASVSFASACRLFLQSTMLMILEMESPLSYGRYVIVGTIAVVLGIVLFGFQLRSRKQKSKGIVEELSELIYENKIQGQALIKINDRLNKDEKREMTRLLYQTSRLEQTTVQNLARALWYGLVTALSFEIAQEFFGRL